MRQRNGVRRIIHVRLAVQNVKYTLGGGKGAAQPLGQAVDYLERPEEHCQVADKGQQGSQCDLPGQHLPPARVPDQQRPQAGDKGQHGEDGHPGAFRLPSGLGERLAARVEAADLAVFLREGFYHAHTGKAVIQHGVQARPEVPPARPGPEDTLPGQARQHEHNGYRDHHQQEQARVQQAQHDDDADERQQVRQEKLRPDSQHRLQGFRVLGDAGHERADLPLVEEAQRHALKVLVQLDPQAVRQLVRQPRRDPPLHNADALAGHLGKEHAPDNQAQQRRAPLHGQRLATRGQHRVRQGQGEVGHDQPQSRAQQNQGRQQQCLLPVRLQIGRQPQNDARPVGAGGADGGAFGKEQAAAGAAFRLLGIGFQRRLFFRFFFSLRQRLLIFSDIVQILGDTAERALPGVRVTDKLDYFAVHPRLQRSAAYQRLGFGRFQVDKRQVQTQLRLCPVRLVHQQAVFGHDQPLLPERALGGHIGLDGNHDIIGVAAVSRGEDLFKRFRQSFRQKHAFGSGESVAVSVITPACRQK